ncbi:Aste57867_9912 [Aphanomyces stellatus]|uniref:Aste57867_1457 protein n=1 Tax=Aphanomyces stellatus TaxID=120398 RepID=A0A485KP22_9STRA|nr:hypothetical protein As57867_009873 [Aphanomyces stellatus]KAF0705978.1 hypothetical protein As57867_006845 [Aphanomyces stellatus]KAF0718833.1 hypothetical protein As57867_001456 [Aphanomyces stellatus]VFT78674.1 Aste57867_1457 [Aphanomyces stellatus]VFT83824.1 Aste57867_6866 [Aphanomyces stellatus]
MQSNATQLRSRGLCMVPDCINKTYARQLCCKHGAKKPCDVQGCNLRARTNGVCYKHGAPKNQCTESGCQQTAQARQKCVKHGGGRPCKAVGCNSHARAGGFCQRHKIDANMLELAWRETSLLDHAVPFDRRYLVVSVDDVSDLEFEMVHPPESTPMPIMWSCADAMSILYDDLVVLQEVLSVLGEP